jgi:hypothetical protein
MHSLSHSSNSFFWTIHPQMSWFLSGRNSNNQLEWLCRLFSDSWSSEDHDSSFQISFWFLSESHPLSKYREIQIVLNEDVEWYHSAFFNQPIPSVLSLWPLSCQSWWKSNRFCSYLACVTFLLTNRSDHIRIWYLFSIADDCNSNEFKPIVWRFQFPIFPLLKADCHQPWWRCPNDT